MGVVDDMTYTSTNHKPLYLESPVFRLLLEKQGPSLGLWRAAEVAALKEQSFPKPVLDLGCGDGLVTSLVLPEVEFGIDPDETALERAGQLGIYQKVFAIPVERAPLAAGSIATILSNSVLEHIPNLDEVLSVAAQILRPGGRLIFTVPTESFSDWLALPLSAYAAWRNRSYAHRNLWSVTAWNDHLMRAGLGLRTVRPYLRRQLVTSWDFLELLQMIWIARRRLVGILWKRLPSWLMKNLAQRASGIDLSAPAPGGGRLIVARKPL